MSASTDYPAPTDRQQWVLMCDEIDGLRAELAHPPEGAVAKLAEAMVDQMLTCWGPAVTHQPTLRKAVAATVRTIAEWGSLATITDEGEFVCVNVTRGELIALAVEVEQAKVDDWWSCPVCQESACDPSCPLEPLRRPGRLSR